MLMPLAVAEALSFPALSVHGRMLTARHPRSKASTGASEQLSIPERVSLPPNDTVTSVLCQPLALGLGRHEALTVGAVLSILMPPTVVEAELPALSTAVPAADWWAPSALSV